MNNVLFVSAGDKTVFYENWLDENRNYDIIVCYYGSNTDKKYEKYANFYFERKGSKFQNFSYLWNKNVNDFRNYKNYFIVDDDIIIKTNEINELFEYMDKFDLWILQPSFNVNSKISHKITKQQMNSDFRYVNFIEINAPIFSNYAITKCMKVYDNELVGYGLDYLFLTFLGTEHKNKYAIVDKISCINPYSEVREIDLLQDSKIRLQKWKKIKDKLGISEYEHIIWKKEKF